MKWCEAFGWSRTTAWFIILAGLFWLLWSVASGAVPEQMRLWFLVRSVLWIAVIAGASELLQWFWYAQMVHRRAAREEDAVLGWSLVLCLPLVLGIYYYLTSAVARTLPPAQPVNAESYYLSLLFPLAVVSIFAPMIAITLFPPASRLRIAQRVSQLALVVLVLWPTYFVSVNFRADATRARLTEAMTWMNAGKPERALVACVQARFLTPWNARVWHCLDDVVREMSERGWDIVGQQRLP